MPFVSIRFPLKCTVQGIQRLKNKLPWQMERVLCRKTKKYLVKLECCCFCCDKMACFGLKCRFCLAFTHFLFKIAQNVIAFLWGRHLALFISRKVMAQSRIPSSDFCVWNLPILCLSKIGKISKIIKILKNIRLLVSNLAISVWQLCVKPFF